MHKPNQIGWLNKDKLHVLNNNFKRRKWSKFKNREKDNNRNCEQNNNKWKK